MCEPQEPVGSGAERERLEDPGQACHPAHDASQALLRCSGTRKGALRGKVGRQRWGKALGKLCLGPGCGGEPGKGWQSCVTMSNSL